MTIDEINIGSTFIGGTLKNSDRYAKLKGVVTNKTSNSIELEIFATSKDGVDAKQWFRFEDFEKQFLVV